VQCSVSVQGLDENNNRSEPGGEASRKLDIRLHGGLPRWVARDLAGLTVAGRARTAGALQHARATMPDRERADGVTVRATRMRGEQETVPKAVGASWNAW
jgi:hypothetical protein